MRGKLIWLAFFGLIGVLVIVLWQQGWLDVLTDGEGTQQRRRAGPPPEGAQLATFGGGCFWCTEAIFQRMNGVHDVVSGYSGGSVKNPSYEQVCTGTTGHAEVVQIVFDPKLVSFVELLEVFWRTHDPTTMNRQGNDVGTQYRSVVFYHNEEQREIAERCKRDLDQSGAFAAPIVTAIVPFKAFYPAEAYHQGFFQDHPRNRYSAGVIRPKLEKFEAVFRDKLKPATAK